MLKKLLCLIAITMVLTVFDAPAMDSVDHSSTENFERKRSSIKTDAFHERLINKQIEIIKKTKKSRKSLESEPQLDSPKLSKV